MSKNIVVFSTVSKDHDMPGMAQRWDHWRPLVELMRIPSFSVRRLYYFILPSQVRSNGVLISDLQSIAPQADIVPVPVRIPHDFSSINVLDAYHFFDNFFEQFTFDTKENDYYFHFGPGNLFSHAFMLTMLINIRKMPCRIVHLRFPRNRDGSDSRAEVYNCDISNWVSQIGRFEQYKADSLSMLKSSIETGNLAFNKLISRIEHVASHSTAPMLLSGPTGSGKSRLANKIYELRKKRGLVSGEFVELNCATLRGDSAMSVLFGHVRGAFTGAAQARKGVLLSADKGLLFLDEIGELTLDMQVLLLKAIEEKRFMPFGADISVISDFQLVCASNRDLPEEVRQGRFRLDLFSRINLWHFNLPYLRDRPEDIEPNIDYELQRITVKRGVLADFTPAARTAYLRFARSEQALWPGNFRALSGSVERMITYAFNGIITEAEVEEEIALLIRIWADVARDPNLPECSASAATNDPADQRFPLLRSLAATGMSVNNLDLFDKVQLEETLRVCLDSTSRSDAGKRLFSHSRTKKKGVDDTARLNKYLKKNGLSWKIIHAQCKKQG